MLRLIPAPKLVELQPGTFQFNAETTVGKLPGTEQLGPLAIEQLIAEVQQRFGINIKPAAEPGSPSISLVIAEEGAATYQELGPLRPPADGLGPEGYVLSIAPTKILVAAPDYPGLFYGVQTLRQLIRANAGESEIPCCQIVDWPSFQYRGWQDDISRGPIPTMDSLKQQVRLLSEAKLNLMTLYTEHVFKLTKHPKIAPADGITAEQVTELVAYAKKHHVEVAGNFQSFGHFRNILQIPEYAKLGEDNWVLSPALEESYEFLAEVFSEIVPVYESPLFNINCDETWGLGTGASKEMVERMGLGAVYAGHISRVVELLRPYGKRPMMWGDIASNHPELMGGLPKDLILLGWNYRAQEDFDHQIKPAVDSGFDFMVCPGVNCWVWFWPRFEEATVNIHNFIREGARQGAIGVLNTSWDDNGEPFFGANWYPFYWGAECSWTAPAPAKTPEQGVAARLRRSAWFDRCFGPVFYGIDDREVTQLLKRLSALGDHPFAANLRSTVFWEGPDAKHVRGIRPSSEEVAQFVSEATALVGMLEARATQIERHRHSLRVAWFAARQALFLGRHWQARLDALADLEGLGQDEDGKVLEALVTIAARFEALGEEAAELKRGYARLWAAEYRPWWLDRNLAKFDGLLAKLADQVERTRQAKDDMESKGILPTAASLGVALPLPSKED